MAPTIVETVEGMQDVEISKENGLGHETMGDFVRHHMQCILKPFADHVDELHKAVDMLQNDLIETTNLSQGNRARLDRHDETLADLRCDTNKVTEHAKLNARNLDEARGEHRGLHAGHEQTKRDLQAVSSDLQTTSKFVTDSQHGLAATNTIVEEVQHLARATNENIGRSIEPGIHALRMDLKDLVDRVAAAKTLLDTTKVYGEGVHHGVQVHLKAYELQRLKDERTFAQINQSSQDITKMIRDTDHRVSAQSEQLKTTQAMMRPLKIHTEQLSTTLKAQEQKHTDIVREVTDFMERFAQAKVQLDKLVDKFLSDEDSNQGPDIFETVGKLSEVVNTACAKISELEATSESHTDALKTDSGRIDVSVLEMAQTKDRVAKIEDKIGFNDPPEPPPKASKWGAAKTKTGVDQHGGQAIANAVKMLSITQGQKKNKDKLDSTAADLEQTKSNLSSTKEELKEAENRVKVLEAGLASTNELVSKLGLGLDLSQEYWSGLSKGFRDTHRAVAIDNDMLPPKGSHAVTLPAIPTGSMHPTSPTRPSSKRPASQGGRPTPHTAR